MGTRHVINAKKSINTGFERRLTVRRRHPVDWRSTASWSPRNTIIIVWAAEVLHMKSDKKYLKRPQHLNIDNWRVRMERLFTGKNIDFKV